MPVYLFTYHTYGSWMPDRPQGYVRRGEGVLPQDHDMADAYRKKMSQEATLLTGAHQEAVIATLLEAAMHIDVKHHGIATEPTHVHVLTSWQQEKTHMQVGTSLKRAVTSSLKERFGEREWLSENRSRKRVEDREHFVHLVENYLPKHSGWCWDQCRGCYKHGEDGGIGEA